MIQDKDGNLITTMEDWAKIYTAGSKAKHWKPGRSAYSVADYVLNHNGIDRIRARIAEIYQQDIFFVKVIPELEVRFDKLGYGREHDLGIKGVTQNDSSLFVGLEAKVDEPFGNTILDAYLDAKIKEIGGESTNAPKRIEDLLKLRFGQPDKSVFGLRYQLLYATAGTLKAGKKKSVLYIIVFKTDLYDEMKGMDNFRDYILFLNALQAEELPCSRQDSRVHKMMIGEEELISIYEQIEFKC